MSSNEDINQFLNDQLGNWSENVVRLLIDNVKSKQLILTSELLNSFQYQVIKATGDTLAGVKIAFNDYSRMHEMKNLFYTKRPPLEAIENFILKTGLSKFKYVPGYREGKIPAENIAVKRIAWGIANARFNGIAKYKPVKWFNKAFYGQINVLIRNLLDGYQEHASKAITESLRQG